MASPGAEASEAAAKKETWPRDDPSKFIVMRTDPKKDAWDYACKLWHTERDRCLLATSRTTIDKFFTNSQITLWGDKHCTAILVHVQNIVITQLNNFTQPIIDGFLATDDKMGLWSFAFQSPREAFTGNEIKEWGDKFLQHALWIIRIGFPGQMRNLENFLAGYDGLEDQAGLTDQAVDVKDSPNAPPVAVTPGGVSSSLRAELVQPSQRAKEEADATRFTETRTREATEDASASVRARVVEAQPSSVPTTTLSNDNSPTQPVITDQQPTASAQGDTTTPTTAQVTGSASPQQTAVPCECPTNVYLHPHRRATSIETLDIDKGIRDAEQQASGGSRVNNQENRDFDAGRGMRQPPQGPSQPRRGADPHRIVSAPPNRRISPQYAQSPHMSPFAPPVMHHAATLSNMPGGYLQTAQHSPMQQPPHFIVLPGGQIAQFGPAVPNRGHPFVGQAQGALTQHTYGATHAYGIMVPSGAMAQHYPYNTQQLRPSHHGCAGTDFDAYNYGHTQGFQSPAHSPSEGFTAGSGQQQNYPRKWTNGSRGQRRDSMNQHNGRVGRGGPGRLYDHNSNAYVMTGPGPSRYHNGPAQEPFPPYIDTMEGRRRISNPLEQRPDRCPSNSFGPISEHQGGLYGEYHDNIRPTQPNRRGSRAGFTNRGDQSGRGGRRVSGAEPGNPHRSSFSTSANQSEGSRGRVSIPRGPSRHSRTGTGGSSHGVELARTQHPPSAPKLECASDSEGTLRKTASGGYEFEFFLQPSPPAGRGPSSASPLPSEKAGRDIAFATTASCGGVAEDAQDKAATGAGDAILRKSTPSSASDAGFTASSSGDAMTEGSGQGKNGSANKKSKQRNKRKQPKPRGTSTPAQTEVKGERFTTKTGPALADPSAAENWHPKIVHAADETEETPETINDIEEASIGAGKFGNNEPQEQQSEVKQRKDDQLDETEPEEMKPEETTPDGEKAEEEKLGKEKPEHKTLEGSQPEVSEQPRDAERIDTKEESDTSTKAAVKEVALPVEKAAPRRQVPVPLPIAVDHKIMKRSSEIKKLADIDEWKESGASSKTTGTTEEKAKARSQAETASTNRGDHKTPTKMSPTAVHTAATPNLHLTTRTTASTPTGSNADVTKAGASPESASDLEKSFMTAASHVADDNEAAGSEIEDEVTSTTETEKFKGAGSEKGSETAVTERIVDKVDGCTTSADSREPKNSEKVKLMKQKGASSIESLNPFAIAKAQRDQERRNAKAQRKKERKTQGKHKDQSKVQGTNVQMLASPVVSLETTPEVIDSPL